MSYGDIRFDGIRGHLNGCPHDGLGCPYGQRCSINSRNKAVRSRAWNASKFGPDFICVKRQNAEKRSTSPERKP